MNTFLFKVWITVSMTNSAITARRLGWLDRLVQYQKKLFLDDLEKVGTFNVKVVSPPSGYKDSENWDYDSVNRLLKLIYSSDTPKPLRRQLNAALVPTRRYMSPSKSLIKIPSLSASHPGFFYDYVESNFPPEDDDSDIATGALRDSAILYITNPIESRMPSRHISVGHIKEILMARAQQSKQLATKSSKVFVWQPTTKACPAAKKISSSSTAKTEDKASAIVEDNTESEDKATEQADDKETTEGDGDENGKTEGDADATEGATATVDGNATEDTDSTVAPDATETTKGED